MKLLAIASLALAANIAVSAISVNVYGYGTNREAAKRDAFRNAIENVCGTKVLSKRENFNNQNTYDQVAVHSTCRVTGYSVLSETSDPYSLYLNVKIYDTRQQDRIYSQSNGFQFSNDLYEHIEEYYHEKQTGDHLIDVAFRGYPQNAFIIQNTKKPYIIDDHYRNLYLIIPYKITWNYEFIEEMQDIFGSIDNRRGAARITVMAKNPKSIILGKRNNYFIDDFEKLNHIKEKFVGEHEMRIRVSARDNKGKKILNLCYSPEYKMGGIFYSIGVDRQLTIFGNDVNKGELQIKLNIPAEVIYDLTVDITSERDCKLYSPPL